MNKLRISTVNSIQESDLTIIGFTDESKSDARHKGSSKGPDTIRDVYNDTLYFGDRDAKIPILPMSGNMNKKIYDLGNTSRDEFYNLISKVCNSGKIPITLGGDHSLTTLALRAIGNTSGSKVGLLYFDAHPDFLTSIKDHHGSVISDSMDFIDFRRSLILGMRAAEPEEMKNLTRHNLESLTPLDINESGLPTIAKKISSKCGTRSKIYLSIDLDCIDESIAPGVAVPSAAGLMPLDVIFLVKKICSTLSVVGMDIVELCPDYDLNNNTAKIGARLLLEAIASIV